MLSPASAGEKLYEGCDAAIDPVVGQSEGFRWATVRIANFPGRDRQWIQIAQDQEAVSGGLELPHHPLGMGGLHHYHELGSVCIGLRHHSRPVSSKLDSALPRHLERGFVCRPTGPEKPTLLND